MVIDKQLFIEENKNFMSRGLEDILERNCIEILSTKDKTHYELSIGDTKLENFGMTRGSLGIVCDDGVLCIDSDDLKEIFEVLETYLKDGVLI